MGVVYVEPGPRFSLRYLWQAGTECGRSATLQDAKRRVEQEVLMGGRQLALFD